MNTKKYTLLAFIAILFASCEDYLDKIDNIEALTELDIFADVNLAEDYLNAGYTFLITEISDKSQHSDILSGMIMSDEGYPGRYNNNTQERYQSFASGDYLFLMDLNSAIGQRDTPKFAVRYDESWKGIRIVNTFLANVDLIENADEETVNGMLGQAYFLRAFYYHLLTKRHGGLIYLTENLDLNSDLARERESYESNLENILIDLERAIDLLPKNWVEGNIGKPTKGAAMALKSRITLFAASPLVNTNNDQKKWEDAADAASDMINYSNENGMYQLIDASDAINIDVDHNGTDLFVAEPEELKNYRNIFVGPGKSKALPQEAIFMEVNDNVLGNSGLVPLPRTYLTSGFDIVKGNFNPQSVGATANFVGKFETKNGLAIEDDPSYNDQEPFINRDPRFYNAILFDGVPWQHTTAGPLNGTGFTDLAVVNEEGILGLDLHNPTTPANRLWQTRNATGYRIRKWVPNGLYLRSGGSAEEDFHVNSTIFRMSEFYLNYAEAANEAYGPTGKASNQSLSSLDAVNVIRNRVGMPNVNSIYTGSASTLRERIRNERAIEFCFEAMRYDDIRRWKIAHLEESKKVEFLEMRWQGGETPTFPTGFSFENVEQTNLNKTFIDKHYWWPIPSSELEAVPVFGQTENW